MYEDGDWQQLEVRLRVAFATEGQSGLGIQLATMKTQALHWGLISPYSCWASGSACLWQERTLSTALRAGAIEKKTKVAFEFADKLYPSFVSQGSNLQNNASVSIDQDFSRAGCAEALLEPLRRVLLAFAVKNPEVGYCQSMDLIVAVLLECCDEENTFWILCHLVEDVLPENYTRSLVGVRVETMVLECLSASCLPTLHQHLLQYGVFFLHSQRPGSCAFTWTCCQPPQHTRCFPVFCRRGRWFSCELPFPSCISWDPAWSWPQALRKSSNYFEARP